MKKSKLLLFLIPTLLFSCGGTGTPTSSSEEPKDFISNRGELKTHLESLSDSIRSFNVKIESENSYGKTFSDYEYVIENNEITIKTNITSDEVSTSATQYYGFIENTVYELYSSVPSDSFDYVNRNTYSDTEIADAKDEFARLVNENDFKYFINDTAFGIGGYFIESNIDTTFRITNSNDETSIHSKACDLGLEYMFIAEFDSENKAKEISVSKKSYSSSDWDEENNAPKVGSTPIYTYSYEISDFSYGRETVSETSISFEGYFIQSLSGEVKLYTSYQDVDTMVTTKSEANKLFPESIISTANLFDDGLTYSPETAIDQSSIVITSSSNENAVYKDDYGRWVTTTAIGEKSTLTLGNNSNPSMISVEVEIVELSFNTTVDDSKYATLIPASIKEWGAYDIKNSQYYFETTLSIANGEVVTYGLPADNAGPFKDLGKITYTYSDESICSLTIAEMNYSYGSYSSWFVYFDIEPKQVGSTTVTIKLNNQVLWDITIKVI